MPNYLWLHGLYPSVHSIFQARILQCVAIFSSKESFWLRARTCISCTGRWILYCWVTWADPPLHVIPGSEENRLNSVKNHNKYPTLQFNCSVVSNSLQPHGLLHTMPPCLSPTPGVYSNSCPSNWWCHPTISPSVISYSSCLQSFPALGSFQMNQFFTSGGQIIGVSASTSILPMNIPDWHP